MTKKESRSNPSKQSSHGAGPTSALKSVQDAPETENPPPHLAASHLSQSNILALQRTVGNQAVQRMLQNRGSAPIQRAPKNKTSLVGAKDPGYMDRANAFEDRLGFYAFNHPHAKHAAQTSVTRMKDVLVGSAPSGNAADQEWQAKIVQTFGRDRKLDAGQVGQVFQPVWDVLTQGNLREQMTAFYNAAYGGFKSMMIEAINAGSWSDLEEKGFNVSALKKRNKLLGSRRKGLKELYLSASNPFHRGGLTKFTKSNMFHQPFARKNKGGTSERTPADLAGYKQGNAQYGAELSDREKKFMFESDTENAESSSAKLPWEEGATRFDVKQSAQWVKKAQAQLRMPVKTGPSGSTDRMMDTYTFLNPGVHPADFRLALLAWMLTGNDHSFHEIMSVAAEKGLGLEYTPGPTAYMNIKPLTESELRSKVAEKGRFPHESGYYAKLKAREYKVIPSQILDDAKQSLKELDTSEVPGSENLSKGTMAALYSYTLGGYRLQNALLQWGPLGKMGVKKALNTIYWYKTQYDRYKDTNILKAEKEGNFNELGGLYQLAQDFHDGNIKIGDIVKETKAHNAMTVQALDKLKPYVGLVYRGTTDWKRRKIGDTITLDGFVSTSTDLSIAVGFANDAKPGFGKEPVIMEMDSRTGRDISELSALKDEGEILFKPGTTFTVVDKFKPGGNDRTHLRMTEGGGSANQQKLEQTGKLGRKDQAFFILKLAVQTENAVRGAGTLGEFGGALTGKPLFSHGWIELELHSRYKNLQALKNDKQHDGDLIYKALEDSTIAELQSNKRTSIGMYSRGLREPESKLYAGKATGAKSYVLDGVVQVLNLLKFIRNRRAATVPLWAEYDSATDDAAKDKIEKKLKKAANFSYIRYNCTTFALDATRAAGFEPGDMKTRLFLGASDPTKLYKMMYMQSELGDKSVAIAQLGDQYNWQKKPHLNHLKKARDVRHLSPKDQKKLEKLKLKQPQAPTYSMPNVPQAPKAGTVYNLDFDAILKASVIPNKDFMLLRPWFTLSSPVILKEDLAAPLDEMDDSMYVAIKSSNNDEEMITVGMLKAMLAHGLLGTTAPVAQEEEEDDEDEDDSSAPDWMRDPIPFGTSFTCTLADAGHLLGDLNQNKYKPFINRDTNTFSFKTGWNKTDQGTVLDRASDTQPLPLKDPTESSTIYIKTNIVKQLIQNGSTIAPSSDEDEDEEGVLVPESDESVSIPGKTEDGEVEGKGEEKKEEDEESQSTEDETGDQPEYYNLLTVEGIGLTLDNMMDSPVFERQMLLMIQDGRLDLLAQIVEMDVEELSRELRKHGYLGKGKEKEEY